MQAITITSEKSAFVDDNDFETLNKFHWFLVSTTTKSGKTLTYAMRNICLFSNPPMTIQVAMHRDVMHSPENMVIHHINGCGLDNRKQNLQIMTNSEHLQLHRRPKL